MKKYLKSFPKKINDVKDGIVNLTELQSKKYNSFLKHLFEQENNNNLTLCLRGENVKNLTLKLEQTKNKLEISEFYRRLFLLGDKSKPHYLCNISDDNPSKWSVDIGKTVSEDFNFLFYEFSFFVKKNNFNWNDENSDVVSYFSNSSNESIFVDTISGLPELQKLLIRDYYFWFLHTGSNGRFDKSTYYVPTTTDPKICENYAYGDDDKDGPIALICFVPSNMAYVASSFSTFESSIELLKNESLPIIKSEPFPDEFEISFKAALFPHFIIGAYNYLSDEIVLNHNIFKKQNSSFNNIFKYGIKINQNNFFEYLKKTKYSTSSALYSNGQYNKIR